MAQAKLPYSPMGIPQQSGLQRDVTVAGAYLNLGILIGRLYNLGESSASITGALREALSRAKHDGIGQEA